jgi:hypothetical protein
MVGLKAFLPKFSLTVAASRSLRRQGRNSPQSIWTAVSAERFPCEAEPGITGYRALRKRSLPRLVMTCARA